MKTSGNHCFKNKPTLISSGLLSLMFMMIGCWPFNQASQGVDCDDNSHGISCTRIDTLYVQNPDNPNDSLGIPVKCNQVIFMPSDSPALKSFNDEIRNYLRRKCFEPEFICPCTPAFELWENRTTEGIDVGVVVAGAPRTSGGGADVGLLPNILLDTFEPDVSLSQIDSVRAGKSGCLSGEDSVTIAIVDTGIDTLVSPTSAYRARQTQRERSEPAHWRHYHENNLSCAPRRMNHLSSGIRFADAAFDASNVDYHSHGTAIHGVITGNSNINFDGDVLLSILNVKTTLGKTKQSYLFDNLCGINYAVEQRAQIINLSWGFKYFISEEDSTLTNSLFTAFTKVIRANPNVIFVAAAGNDSMKLDRQKLFLPASLSRTFGNLISVGALGWYKSDTAICPFSNYSDHYSDYVDVYAPGYNIAVPYKMAYSRNASDLSRATQAGSNHSTDHRSSPYLIKSGTSLAAPYVVRVAAMLRSRYPQLQAGQIKGKIVDGARIMKDEIKGIKYKVVLLKNENEICKY